MKKITSTIESTTNKNTSSDVLFLKATLYGTIIAVREKFINIGTKSNVTLRVVESC